MWAPSAANHAVRRDRSQWIADRLSPSKQRFTKETRPRDGGTFPGTGYPCAIHPTSKGREVMTRRLIVNTCFTALLVGLAYMHFEVRLAQAQTACGASGAGMWCNAGPQYGCPGDPCVWTSAQCYNESNWFCAGGSVLSKSKKNNPQSCWCCETSLFPESNCTLASKRCCIDHYYAQLNCLGFPQCSFVKCTPACSGHGC